MGKTTKRRALLIVNPHARNGRGYGVDIRSALERGGLQLIERNPQDDETISDLILREKIVISLLSVVAMGR